MWARHTYTSPPAAPSLTGEEPWDVRGVCGRLGPILKGLKVHPTGYKTGLAINSLELATTLTFQDLVRGFTSLGRQTTCSTFRGKHFVPGLCTAWWSSLQ